jgi:hypothetical protein
MNLWPDFGGGLGKPDTFIGIAKGLIDELNADHTGDGHAATEFTRTTHAMCFYDSIIVFERGEVHEEVGPAHRT